ncbi:bile acid-CoA:amino acid N-acyltransferase-like [Physella acuta]|uniref:bile acid-CoA:amino acid N-acyltransferase-like n=1 Tax=Physella acuta TaxID=109671 RepID=UPI0027DCC0E9|nr:bile acid-CoA:amino acid N-acyltransferase-like [Physella acuta]
MLAARRIHIINGHFLQAKNATVSASPVQIKLSKDAVLIDEKVKIEVTGLGSGQKVTIQACFSEGDKTFGSCGHYVADQNGNVDTFRDICLGGTYSGLNPMGLFTSASTTPGIKPGRLIKSDVMTPYEVTLAVHDGFIKFNQLSWSDQLPCLVSCVLLRSYTAPGVRRFPVRENGIYGTLFVPPGEGPFPGVIDVFGMGGASNIEFRSALLASHGIASFALAYYGLPGLPQNEQQLDFTYFLKAFDWLASNSLIDSKNLGGISTCVGGGYVRLIASRRPAMKCFVTINSGVKIFGRKQTVEGVTVTTSSTKNIDDVKIVDDCFVFSYMYQLEDVTLGDDDVKGWVNGAKVLAIHGLDDQCVNPIMLDVLENNVPEDLRENYTFLRYPGAGHLLEPPYAPLCKVSYNKMFDIKCLWGGDDVSHSIAQEDSWPRILEFLKRNLQSKK